MQNLSTLSKALFVSLFFLTFLAGCEKHHDLYGGRFGDFDENPTAATLPPVVISTTPTNGDLGVSTKTRIVAVFNKLMDSTTINSTTFLVRLGSAPVTGTVTFSGITAIFTPASDLTTNATYSATVTMGVKDVKGLAMDHDHVWIFKTGSGNDLTIPTVISTNPAKNATAVSITTAITASFSEAIDPTTITATTFPLKQGTTLVSGEVIGLENRAAFALTSKLAPFTTYTAVLTTGVKDPRIAMKFLETFQMLGCFASLAMTG